MFLGDLLAEAGKFMDSGGSVLWAIVGLLFVMWTLLFERMWYLRGAVGADISWLWMSGRRDRSVALNVLGRCGKRLSPKSVSRLMKTS